MAKRKLSAADERRREHGLRLLARMIADAVRAEQLQARERQEAQRASSEPCPAMVDVGIHEEEG